MTRLLGRIMIGLGVLWTYWVVRTFRNYFVKPESVDPEAIPIAVFMWALLLVGGTICVLIANNPSDRIPALVRRYLTSGGMSVKEALRKLPTADVVAALSEAIASTRFRWRPGGLFQVDIDHNEWTDKVRDRGVNLLIEIGNPSMGVFRNWLRLQPDEDVESESSGLADGGWLRLRPGNNDLVCRAQDALSELGGPLALSALTQGLEEEISPQASGGLSSRINTYRTYKYFKKFETFPLAELEKWYPLLERTHVGLKSQDSPSEELLALLVRMRPDAHRKEQAPGPAVQRVEIATSDPHLAAALFARFIREQKICCDCGGKWENRSGDIYRCCKCGTERILIVSYGA